MHIQASLCTIRAVVVFDVDFHRIRYIKADRPKTPKGWKTTKDAVNILGGFFFYAFRINW